MAGAAARTIAAEALGMAGLPAIVVGSGVMADALTADDAVALLARAIATGAGLVVPILVLGPVSGAHMNPGMTLAFLMRGEIGAAMATAYALAQVLGSVAGVALAHAMFDRPIVQLSIEARDGIGRGLGEGVATFALVPTIPGTLRSRPEAVPFLPWAS